MTWPNGPTWSAERSWRVETSAGARLTQVVDCGSILLPSGHLVASDPFAGLRPRENPFVVVPPGKYPVTVTLADVSDALDGSHIREAYASVRFTEGPEQVRRAIPLAREGEPRPELQGDEFIGFPVDSGTACFVDDSVLLAGMPEHDKWEEIFDGERDDRWFKLMDDPNHIRAGIANIRLPFSKSGENIVIIHAGWGDGVYPVVGSFDSNNVLVGVHIDFGVVE